jgi:DNA helicase-2/ATP-dependent DNA helicase PcrA
MSLEDVDRIYKNSNYFGLKGKTKQSWENFYEILKQIDCMKNGKPSDVLHALVSVSDYLSFLKKEDDDSFIERKKNVDELYNIACSYPTLEDFVANMTLNEAEQPSEDDNRVNLMTIHGSKGGEWQTVIVVGCNQGILPCLRSNVEEERRLMYVAMTRAKEYLFLTRAMTMMNHGQLTTQEPSIFLSEIDPQYIRKQ